MLCGLEREYRVLCLEDSSVDYSMGVLLPWSCTICLYVCTVCLYVCTYVCSTYVCTYVCNYVCMCACIYVCMHINYVFIIIMCI